MVGEDHPIGRPSEDGRGLPLCLDDGIGAENLRRFSAGSGREPALHGPPYVLSKDARRAMLVGTDSGYGMVRMFNLSLRDDALVYEIFRDEDEACRFVGF